MCSKRKKVGLGVVVKDDNGKLKGALIHNITGNLSAHASEILTVLFEMRFCLMNDFKSIEVKSDAMNIVVAISNPYVDLSIEGQFLMM